LFTTLGSFIWNFVLVMAGYLLGDQWDLVERYVGVLSKVVLGLVVAALVVWVVRRVRARRGERQTDHV
ncbi:DedA family protein, partial [Streptomyces sp. SID7982]|nr:DedA family protein [Streptomyces sp. SID7982]